MDAYFVFYERLLLRIFRILLHLVVTNLLIANTHHCTHDDVGKASMTFTHTESADLR